METDQNGTQEGESGEENLDHGVGRRPAGMNTQVPEGEERKGRNGLEGLMARDAESDYLQKHYVLRNPSQDDSRVPAASGNTRGLRSSLDTQIGGPHSEICTQGRALQTQSRDS